MRDWTLYFTARFGNVSVAWKVVISQCLATKSCHRGSWGEEEWVLSLSNNEEFLKVWLSLIEVLTWSYTLIICQWISIWYSQLKNFTRFAFTINWDRRLGDLGSCPQAFVIVFCILYFVFETSWPWKLSTGITGKTKVMSLFPGLHQHALVAFNRIPGGKLQMKYKVRHLWISVKVFVHKDLQFLPH